MNPWEEFTGLNAGYVLDLYERYQRDPESVDEATRAVFARWTPEIEAEPGPDSVSSHDGFDSGDRDIQLG